MKGAVSLRDPVTPYIFNNCAATLITALGHLALIASLRSPCSAIQVANATGSDIYVATGALGTTAVQTLTPSSTPVIGVYKVGFGSNTSTALQYNATASQIQTALRLLAGLGSCTVTGTLATGLVTITCAGIDGPVTAFVISDISTLLNAGSAQVTVAVATTVTGVNGSEINKIIIPAGSTSPIIPMNIALGTCVSAQAVTTDASSGSFSINMFS